MLTEQQLKFCKYISLYEYTPQQAFFAAGYTVDKKRYLTDRIVTLLQNPQISAKIDELRSKYLDVDKVRTDIILEHQKTRDFDLSEIIQPVGYLDGEGVQRYRLEVKPIADWSPIARQNLIGFDKNNIPIFRNKEAATKELSRIFGLYKDNMVTDVQDLSSIYNDALGIESDDSGVDTNIIIDSVSQDEMETLDAQIMQAEDDDEESKAKAAKLRKEIKDNPSDANKIKLRSLLGE